MDNKDNRRSNFRVNVLIPVSWQVLDRSETDLIKKRLGSTLLRQNCLKNPIEEISEESFLSLKDDQIYRSFQLLNNKLDYIINMMQCESEAVSAEDRLVEISASGLKFRTLENIAPGVFLKMNLMIPGASCFQIELIVETMRIEKTENAYIIATNIICIDEDVRDLIVKIVFQKQRIDIRRLRTNQEVIDGD